MNVAEALIVKTGGMVVTSTETTIMPWDTEGITNSSLDALDGNYSLVVSSNAGIDVGLDQGIPNGVEGSNAASALANSSVLYVLKCIVLVCIILLAIFSNLLVVISVFRYHKLRHINNYFLVSLAVADLFVACFAMTFNASVEITGKWNFGYTICNLWNSLDVHFSTVSTLHLCCIAVDRYFAIVRPLKYTTYMTVKVAACMIGVAWTAPTLISFLPIFLGWYTTAEHLKWHEDHPNECFLRVNKPYAFISSTLTFWAPVIVMLVMYRRIYKEALRQKEAIRRSSVPSQQHLIVDSDSVRSRFQTLQANGFRSSNNLKKLPAVTNQQSATINVAATPPAKPTAPPAIIMTSSESNEGLTKIDEVETKFDSNTTTTNGNNGTTTTDGSGQAPAAPAPPQAPAPTAAPPGTPSQATPPAFPGPTQSTTKKEPTTAPSSTSSPVRNVLTPTANLLGTVQRRLSFANTNIAEEITPFNLMTEAYPGATSVMGVWTLGLGFLGDRLRERHRIHTSWRKEHKAFVTLGIVMGAFLLCWLPFFTWYLTVTICGDDCPCPDIVVSILFWIGYFNSTLNPLIYVMTNRDFKDAFTDILRKIFCCCCTGKGCRACCGEGSANGPEYTGNSNLDYV